MTRHVAVGWIICLCFSKLQMILNPRVYLICNKFTPLYSWQLNPQNKISISCNPPHTNDIRVILTILASVRLQWKHYFSIPCFGNVNELAGSQPKQQLFGSMLVRPRFLKHWHKKYWGSCWIGYKQTLVFLIKHWKLQCHRYRTHNDVPSYVLSFNCCWWY